MFDLFLRSPFLLLLLHHPLLLLSFVVLLKNFLDKHEIYYGWRPFQHLVKGYSTHYMPSWYVWQSLAHWAHSSYDYPETEGGYNLLATIIRQITFSAISSKIVFKSKIFYLLHVVFLRYSPKLGAREVKSKEFSSLKYCPQCEFIMCAPVHRCCSSTSSRCGRHDNHNGGRWDNSLCQHYTPVMSLRFGTLNLHTMHIFRTFSLASLLWSVRKCVCRIFQHFWGWLRVGWAPAADFFNLLFSYKNKHLHSISNYVPSRAVASHNSE